MQWGQRAHPAAYFARDVCRRGGVRRLLVAPPAKSHLPDAALDGTRFLIPTSLAHRESLFDEERHDVGALVTLREDRFAAREFDNGALPRRRTLGRRACRTAGHAWSTAGVVGHDQACTTGPTPRCSESNTERRRDQYASAEPTATISANGLPFGLLVIFPAIRLTGSDNFGFGLAGAWMLAFLFCGNRSGSFRCPRCGKKFFSKWPGYNSWSSKCLHCGLPKWAGSQRQPLHGRNGH